MVDNAISKMEEDEHYKFIVEQAKRVRKCRKHLTRREVVAYNDNTVRVISSTGAGSGARGVSQANIRMDKAHMAYEQNLELLQYLINKL